MAGKEGKVPGEVKQDGNGSLAGAVYFPAAVGEDNGVSSLQRARALYKELKLRERDYRIADFNWGQKPGKFVKGTNEFVNFMLDRRKEPDPFKRTKYLMIQGGNGSSKTLSGAYLVACLAIPDDWKKKLNLPELGKKKEILVITKSGDNLKDVIDPYLFGEGSRARIPPDIISDVHRRDRILKNATLKDGTHIRFSTYDQGREVFQGKNPDFVWMDEEATDPEVWTEALMRTRTIGEDGEPCMLFCTMTPLAGPGTPMVEFFNEAQDPEVDAKKKLFFFDSRDNPFADASLYKTLKGHEFQQRVLGVASVPTGLVYHEFRRDRNVIPHFDPTELGYGTRYYAGIDFGVSHPTAIVCVAVDADGNHYVWDVWKKSNASLREIREQHRHMTAKYELEYTVADSAALRERTELELLGLKTVPADKNSKGENGESNRRAGILHINQLLADSKMMISDRCKELVREYETHFYKGVERDGSVVKENDDLCFTGDTLVATARGNVRIDEIVVGDKVITPYGLSTVTNWFYKGEKEVVKFGPITATKDHKVFYGNEFVSIDTHKYEDILVSRLTFKNLLKWMLSLQSFSAEELTPKTARDIITLVSGRAGRFSIGTFGKTIMDVELKKDTTSIILISTSLITTSLIWLSFLLGNTRKFIKNALIQTSSIVREGPNTLIGLGRLLPNGTSQMLQRLSEGWCIKSLTFIRKSIKSALIAVKNIQQSKNRGIAVMRAILSFVESLAKMMRKGFVRFAAQNSRSTNTSSSSVVPMGVRGVYDISVSHGCFYANGILVSNCDSTRYVLMNIKKSSSMTKKELAFKRKWKTSWKSALTEDNVRVPKPY
jgi:phage terminase large subunit